MSHHYSGPDFGFPHGDARLDLTDLYAFPKPGDAGKSILIMNVHPSASVNPPGFTAAEPFAPGALYELKIDTDGDAVADVAYRVRFSASEGGKLTATLRRVEGIQAARTGEGGQAIVEGAPVSMGREARVTDAGDYRFFAGWRSDPFFFDTQGALNNLQFTGDDFFADKDVCGIAIEVPNSELGRQNVGLWARTLDDVGGEWIQADRVRDRSKLSSSPARRTLTISPASRRMMLVSLRPSRTRYNTRAAIRRRMRLWWQGDCCRTFCPTIPNARRASLTTAEHSLTMPSTSSSLFSQTGR
jgi:hypothetical protein